MVWKRKTTVSSRHAINLKFEKIDLIHERVKT